MARMLGRLQNIQTHQTEEDLKNDYESQWATDKGRRHKQDPLGRERMDRCRWWDYDPVGRQKNDIGKRQTSLGIFCVQIDWGMESLSMESYDIDTLSSGDRRHHHYCSVCG